MHIYFDKLPGIQLENCGVSTGQDWIQTKEKISSWSPVDGKLIGYVNTGSEKEYEIVMGKAVRAFTEWRIIPAPKRGDIVRQIGEAFRLYKQELGCLISYETGKSVPEGLGEVQELIDICEFAVGLSRQLYGITMPSERKQHRLFEQYQPLGIVGIITAFNFPVAVWGWNSMLAWVCGDVCVWKPSSKAPLVAVVCQHIVAEVFAKNQVPEGVSSLMVSDRQVAELLVRDKRVPLISATGSTAMGKKIGVRVAERLGRSLLELGGNNAMIISQFADLDLAVSASVFGAIGTAGQRCTSTRRLIIHESIYGEIKKRLIHAYNQLKTGDPFVTGNHMGPLIDQGAVKDYEKAIKNCKIQGGNFIIEGGSLSGPGYESGCYVKPCIAEVSNELPIVQDETFAPILYIMKYKSIEEAIAMQNNVPQGLSSAIMSLQLREVEKFLSATGSDCGIANVNTGTSGAEIGGAFGGEKDTGGGRESGSDAWKVYMRRQTIAVNYGEDLPLAQGISFNL